MYLLEFDEACTELTHYLKILSTINKTYFFLLLQETGCRREDMTGSFSGNLTGISTKPCLNRELVAKLRSMTETIKMLSIENVALREVNDNLLTQSNEDYSQGISKMLSQ